MFIPLGLLTRPAQGFGENEKLVQDVPVLAIIDPVDLNTQKNDPAWGDFLRRNFAYNSNWQVVSHDSMVAKFKDYRLDTKSACHEFQCAFDNGAILGAEFVLFGTITSLEDIYAFTFNLVHVPTSQVVWSKVGEVKIKQRGQPAAALEASLIQMAAYLIPDQILTARHEKHGLLSVLDLSAAASTPSRMLAERVATHLHASRNYDIMGQKEMEELLSALGITKSAFNPTDSSIYWLGSKMDISHLVYSRLQNVRTGGYQLQLALYDVAAKKKVREWPMKTTEEFGKLLLFEDKFFASLFKLPDDGLGYSTKPMAAVQWYRIGAGMGLLLSAASGYLAYQANVDADAAYKRFQNARSRESAEKYEAKVKAHERSSMVYGLVGGLSLIGGASVIAFTF